MAKPTEPDDRRDDVEGQDQEEQAAGGSRVLWSGTLTFGLVSIPVTLMAAVRRGGVPMRLLDAREHAPVQRRYYCPAEDVEVHPEHLQRGYDLGDGRFVLVRDEELTALEPRKSRDIDLRQFVPRDGLQPLLFERSYYLAPAPSGGSNKAYHLLVHTLQETGRAGIATFVMHDKEHLAAILAEHDVLRVQTLRFADEVRDPAAMGLLPAARPSVDAIARYRAIIGELARDDLPTEVLRDEQTHHLAELVQAKEARGQDVVEIDEPQAEQAPVQDLMAALQRSLEAAQAPPTPQPPAKPDAPQPAAGKAPVVAEFDTLSVEQAKDRLEALDTAALRRLRRYEDAHKHRKTLLDAVDRQLRRRGAA